MSVVTAIAPASSTDAAAWFRHKLSLETDCADVYSAMREGEVDFVLLHVVGSEETFARRHLRAPCIYRTDKLMKPEWRSGLMTRCLWSTAPGRTATGRTSPP